MPGRRANRMDPAVLIAGIILLVAACAVVISLAHLSGRNRQWEQRMMGRWIISGAVGIGRRGKAGRDDLSGLYRLEIKIKGR